MLPFPRPMAGVSRVLIAPSLAAGLKGCMNR
jgi:hypothetical protein